MANDHPSEILVNIGGHIYPLDLSEELENGFCSQNSQQRNRVQTADKWTNTEPQAPQPDPSGVTYTVLNGPTNECNTTTVHVSPASASNPPGVAAYTVLNGSANKCSRTAVHISPDSAPKDSLVHLLYQQETDEQSVIHQDTKFSNKQQVLKPLENNKTYALKTDEANMLVDEQSSVEETGSYNVSGYHVQSVQRDNRTDDYDMFHAEYSSWDNDVNSASMEKYNQGVEQFNTRKHDLGYSDIVKSCLDMKPYLSTSVYEELVYDTGSTRNDDEQMPNTKRANSRRYGKTRERGCKVWEFIRNLLLDPATNPSLICWENRQEGIFRIMQPRTISSMWGLKKGNQYMNYEKLSRAMRYHYKKNVLAPVKGKNLIYRFGPGATGWK